MEPALPMWIIVAVLVLAHLVLLVRAGFRIYRSDSTTGQKVVQALFATLIPVLGPSIAMAVYSESNKARAGTVVQDAPDAVLRAGYDALSDGSDVGVGRE